MNSENMARHAKAFGDAHSKAMAMDVGVYDEMGFFGRHEVADGAGNWIAVWQSFHPPGSRIEDFEWRILAARGVVSPRAPAPTR